MSIFGSKAPGRTDPVGSPGAGLDLGRTHGPRDTARSSTLSLETLASRLRLARRLALWGEPAPAKARSRWPEIDYLLLPTYTARDTPLFCAQNVNVQAIRVLVLRGRRELSDLFLGARMCRACRSIAKPGQGDFIEPRHELDSDTRASVVKPERLGDETVAWGCGLSHSSGYFGYTSTLVLCPW